MKSLVRSEDLRKLLVNRLSNWVLSIRLTGSAKTRHGHLDEDLIAGELIGPGGRGLLDLAVLRPLEDCESRHCG